VIPSWIAAEYAELVLEAERGLILAQGARVETDHRTRLLAIADRARAAAQRVHYEEASDEERARAF